MTTYRNMRDIPGPGDPETWPPCTGHPLDPRTEDVFSDDEINEKRIEMAKARVTDSLDWMREAFGECSNDAMYRLFEAFIRGDRLAIGGIAEKLIDVYVLPTDEEAVEALTEERSDDRE